MIVLHSIWFDSTLHLWGERTDLDDCSSVPSGVHPRAVCPQDLHAVVGELSPDGLLASIAGEGSFELWLPANADGPCPSVGDGKAESGGDAVELVRYRVPTLVFQPAEAVDLLVSLPEPLSLNCSDSLRYWSRLARFLSSLLARKQFVPDVDMVSGVNQAVWRVVVQDRTELHWLQRCAQAMPPVCYACVCEKPTNVEPVAIVEDFLQTCADGVIRRSLAEDPFFHQIHERAAGESPWEVRWLSALIGENRVIAGDNQEQMAYINHLRAWIGNVHEPDTVVHTKLCFELVAPEPDGDTLPDDSEIPNSKSDSSDSSDASDARSWRLVFKLQPLDGSTEWLDVNSVWSDGGAAPTILRRKLASRREHLIADLTRASDVFPLIEDSLKSAAPTGMDLTVLEAHSFIRDCAPLLEARGFGVRVPSWAVSRERMLGMRLFLRPRSEVGAVSGRMGLNTLVDFEWRVAVGNTELTASEFEQLRASKAPLVRLNGRWICLDAEAAATAADFLAVRKQGEMTLGQAMRAAAGVDDFDSGLPVVGIDASSWLEELILGAGGAELERLSQPDGFAGTMRPYQLRGLEWLAFMDRVGIGACLADDMGLGKTIQLIALLLYERSQGHEDGPTLIFAPMSVVGNWSREIERFAAGLRVQVHHGPDRLDGDQFVSAVANTDVVITTYALGHRDLATLSRVKWHRMVLDEAQKIKNPSAAQTIAIRSLPSTYRVALTGTPVENHLSELWSIMEMLNPGVLGSAGQFRKRFAVPIERLGDRGRSQQLKSLIRPFVLRRVKTDPDIECELPEKMEMRVYCNLTAEQAALYEQIVAASLGEVEISTGIRRRGVILATLTKLKQVCNHPTHFLRDGSMLDNRSGKCERLVEMLEEVIAEGDSALIFTQFREMGDLLVKLLTERLHTETLFLHGGTGAKQRQAMIDRFQDPAGGVRLFLLSLKAGGLGLNLTAANHVFHFDRWWNPAVEQQATDRAYRIGQSRRVQVHKFVCIGTIEDRIDRMLAEKIALAESIVGSGDDWLTGLSTDELRKYLALSRDSVAEA